MNTDLQQLQESLCKALCGEVRVVPKSKDMAMVLTPFEFADGDAYQLYLTELPGGLLRLSDKGHTLMHLSYRNDTDKFRNGTRAKLLERIKAETDVAEDDGAFYVDTSPGELAPAIWRLSKAMVQVNDLTFLNRERAESTFYEDLHEQLLRLVPEDQVQRNYIHEALEDAANYPIDYRIEGKHAPLFIFGIANKDKAQLVTIILERLKRHKADYESLLIFADQGSLPRPVLARLSNVGGEQIASLDAQDDIEWKIARKRA
ncbi:MAG: DUF1828 domain-containing protein [Flavobacteriales bacterium]|nr:DUF1828 domain-containing protein [Flavobacteriales bacterium]MCB9193526.1 DUF1828 domain-containing protein [Flavobacteriales bacterium]